MVRTAKVRTSKTEIPLTSAQADMLQEIQQRDEYEIDHQLDEIDEALNGLKQIAQLQGEEIQLQKQMLDRVQVKADKNQSRLSKVLGRFRSN